MYNILLVEDDEMIVKGLKYTFDQNDLKVDIAMSHKEAIDCMEKKIYSLIILDITLPDGNGIELGKMIKEQKKIPIMFLTAKDEEETIVECLDLGAEDYILKPFRTRELVSRIQNILKRTTKRNYITCENVMIDLDKADVYVDKKQVKLTSLEYKILVLLFTNANKVVSREIILDKIWDIAGNFVNDNTLSVYIKRIREKLNNENIIKTIKGIGYRVDIE